MAQKAKTDSILFNTILCMVGGGMLMLYSASSVVAQSSGTGGAATSRFDNWVGGWWPWPR